MNDFLKKQASQNRPGREVLSTESLEAMSPVELADALESMLDSMTDENYDPALIDAYLDALDEKVPMPEEPDTEKDFQEFKDKIRAFTSNGESFTKSEESPAVKVKRFPIKRVVGTVAATVAILFTLMVGAQAAGIDVFGNLARWTDELFFFIPASKYTSEYSTVLQEALEEQELPKELAPTWFPDEFTAGEPEIWNDDVSKAVQLIFTNSDGKCFSVNIEQYTNSEALGMLPFEKDASDVELYTNSGRTFYIMSNIDTVTAVWADGNVLETIRGELSVDEIKTMIDSMGG